MLLVPAIEKTLEPEHEESYGQNKTLSILGPVLAADLGGTDEGKKNEQRKKKISVQFRHSSHEIGLYQIGIYVNEYCQETSRRCIPKKLSFAIYFQENKSSAGKATQV